MSMSRRSFFGITAGAAAVAAGGVTLAQAPAKAAGFDLVANVGPDNTAIWTLVPHTHTHTIYDPGHTHTISGLPASPHSHSQPMPWGINSSGRPSW